MGEVTVTNSFHPYLSVMLGALHAHAIEGEDEYFMSER